MGIIEHFLHVFTPRHTNNHRARILHPISITNIITIFLVFQIILTAIAKFSPGVLGYASNINIDDLLKYTNQQRITAGDEPVVLNSLLSSAAQAKAQDMFANQYWAHTSPQGRDPWSFILAAGYNYLYAGENLARDFADSKSVVDAWMKSASHRENLLNSRYKEIGFAVVNGKYNGYETTLVVQMFGTRPVGAPSIEAPSVPGPSVMSATPGAQTATPSMGMVLTNQIPPTGPGFDIFSITKGLSLALVAILFVALLIDGILAYTRKTVRISGHSFAHAMFLFAVLILLNLLGRGIIV